MIHEEQEMRKFSTQVIGKTVGEARRLNMGKYILRITKINGKSQEITKTYNSIRINFDIHMSYSEDSGIITRATIG